MSEDKLTGPNSTKSNDSVPGEDPKRGGRGWIWLAVIVIAVLVAVSLFREQRGRPSTVKAGPPALGVPVNVAKAKKGDIGAYIEALGTVTPVYTVSVTSRVQGQIMSVNFQEGQMVKTDDPLIEIDPRPYEAALTQTRGQLAHDQAVLNEARIDLDRYKQALDQNAIAKQQYDDQEQVVKQGEGTVQNDQGAVENASINLLYCHLRSPINGRVGIRLVDPGNIVQANGTTPLAVITQLQPITVMFNVNEDYLSKIQEKMARGNHLSVDAYDRGQEKKIASGVLQTLDNQIDTTTGTLKFRAAFPNKDNALFPNQFVNARLLVDMQRGQTLIPTPAVQRNSQGAYVYVIKPDQTASVRSIKINTSNADLTAVDGVQPGDVVATTGFDKLQDGVKVSPLDEDASPSPNAKQGS